MKIEHIPWRGYRVRGGDPTTEHRGERLQTEVYMALRQLLGLWADDPDRLAVAVYAYCWLGYNPVGEGVASAVNEISYREHLDKSPWPHFNPPHMDDSEGWDRAEAALRGKQHYDLRNRAKGLLYALEITAPGHEFAKLHEIQVDAAVIECRRLPIEERIAQLRAREETHEQDTPAPAA